MNDCRYIIRISFLALLFAVPAVPAGADDLPRDRAKWRFATISAAQRTREAASKLVDLNQSERIFLTEYLADAMQSNAATHAARADSLRLARQLARDWRMQTVADTLQNSAQELAAQASAPVTVADVTNALGPDWPALVEKQVDAFLDQTFPAVFEESRGRVVALAAAAADQRMEKYPLQAELDNQLDDLAAGHPTGGRLTSSDFDVLGAWLARQAGALTDPVFEEVRVRIGNAGARMQSEIFRQYKFQIKALDAAAAEVPASLRSMDVILPHIDRNMGQRLANLRAEHGAPRYEIFRIVAQNCQDAAMALRNARLAEKQYAEHFAMLENNIPLSEQCLAIIQERRGVPPDTAAAAIKLMRVGGYTGLPDPNTLELLDETAAKIHATVAVRVGEGWWAVTEQLNLVRALETANMEKLRIDVAADRPVRDIAADWRNQLDAQWQAVRTGRPSPYTNLLAGTERQLDKTVRQLYNGIRKESGAAKSATGIKSEPGQGAPIQSRTLEARTEPEAADPRAQDTDATTPPGDTAGEFASALAVVFAADNPHCPDGVLLLTDGADGQCEAKLFSAAGCAGSARFDPDNATAAAAAIFTALQPVLEAMIVGSKDRWTEKGMFAFFRRKSVPEFRLNMIVVSDEIRHRMSLLLHRQIESLLADWSETAGFANNPVSLDWRVGLNLPGIDEKENRTE